MNILLIVLAAVAVFLLKGKGGTAATAKPVVKGGTVNTGTNTTAPSAWSPVVQVWNDRATKSTSDLAVEAAAALPGAYTAVSGLFGGFGSSATGTASPTTSGSGTAVPAPDTSSLLVPGTDDWDTWQNNSF